jgi:hypothetical protein
MEKSLKTALIADESEFKADVREIYQMSDKEETDQGLYPSYNTTPVDNTYVYRPAVYQKNPGPTWLATP